MSNWYYLFWFVEMCIGAVIGTAARKVGPQSRAGIAVTLLLGALAIVELLTVIELRHNVRHGNIVGYVFAWLVLLLPFWMFCLLFAVVGYWLAFWASRRLGIGGRQLGTAGWQFGLSTLLAFVAVYAVVAAIGRMM
jgi:hypothetical protein